LNSPEVVSRGVPTSLEILQQRYNFVHFLTEAVCNVRPPLWVSWTVKAALPFTQNIDLDGFITVAITGGSCVVPDEALPIRASRHVAR